MQRIGLEPPPHRHSSSTETGAWTVEGATDALQRTLPAFLRPHYRDSCAVVAVEEEEEGPEVATSVPSVTSRVQTCNGGSLAMAVPTMMQLGKQATTKLVASWWLPPPSSTRWVDLCQLLLLLLLRLWTSHFLRPLLVGKDSRLP